MYVQSVVGTPMPLLPPSTPPATPPPLVREPTAPAADDEGWTEVKRKGGRAKAAAQKAQKPAAHTGQQAQKTLKMIKQLAPVEAPTLSSLEPVDVWGGVRDLMMLHQMQQRRAQVAPIENAIGRWQQNRRY